MRVTHQVQEVRLLWGLAFAPPRLLAYRAKSLRKDCSCKTLQRPSARPSFALLQPDKRVDRMMQ